MNLKFEIDLEKLSKNIKQFGEEFKKDVTESIGYLASMTHGIVLQQTNELSPPLQKPYRDALSFQRLEEGLWVVELQKEAVWIEDGVKPHSMYDTLLKSPKAKIGKKGKYLAVPFKHSKNPSEMSPKALELASQIKDELKKRNISATKLDLTADGSPRLGRISSFDIESARPSAKAKYPALKGVTIYQTRNKETGKVQRDIMTFRVISESTKGDGRWQNPGRQPADFFDLAYREAERMWENEILPNLYKKYE